MSRELMVAQIPSLRRYARALTGDTWAADDLVQDTLERACNKWRLWLVGTNLRAWLFSVMHNLFVNQLRQSAGGARPAMQDIDELADDLPAPASNPDQALDLQRCLLRLPPEQREVLLLVSMEDMSYAEIAKVTGVPLGTVMSRLSRARARLQALLDAPARVRTEPPADHAVPPRPMTLHRLK
ncbi:sigma-70 family RNA polymerase sigma factor [Rhodoferax sp.]|uniref:RNA polymerase sigma factor n=1 Tax=Rhodoferax sp. TaxID=50421 RepID=UPI0025D5FEB5|nr:sigma-70 family RNA polymerase sigma factor [Rhodoferax sp.]MCM2341583.1 sigma-70 family RNA polymerase sigma factor [Rhodoferax sp.]